MEKVKLELHRKVTNNPDEAAQVAQTMGEYRSQVDHEHLSVFGTRNSTSSDFFIYVFTNRKESSNKQSQLEIEVLKWIDATGKLEIHAQRQYLHRYITDSEGQKDFTNSPFNPEEMCDENHEREFWNKLATSFKKSSDNASRLIFAAGSRGNFVFDLQMFNGELRLYSNADVDQGRAIGLQKRAYVRQFDMISDRFVSMLSSEKVAKWHKWSNSFEMAEIEKNLKETQLRALPIVLRLPKQIYELDPDPKSQASPYLYFAVARQEIFVVNELTC